MAVFLPATRESITLALRAYHPYETITLFYQILEDPSFAPYALSMKMLAIKNLIEEFEERKMPEDLFRLLTRLRPFFSSVPNVKTAKIVMDVIDSLGKMPGASDLQIELCRETVQWARAERRTFLRRRLEARLAALLLEDKEYLEALTLLNGLVKEVRRLDDNLLLVEIHLLESKLHSSLRDLQKAKAALIAAKTAANAVYLPPAQQAAMDFQSGILLLEENDYRTADSYFFEAFEAFTDLEDPKGVLSLKYNLLCMIILDEADNVADIISNDVDYHNRGPDLDAMEAIANARNKRSLNLFEIALRDYKAQLEGDPIVHRHLSSLYDTLLEHNLCRLVEPFSRVEISHISELIKLPVDHVEQKLSRMILDKKFTGIMDQGAGCLVIFDDPELHPIYPETLETILNAGKVVDSLYARYAKIIS